MANKKALILACFCCLSVPGIAMASQQAYENFIRSQKAYLEAVKAGSDRAAVAELARQLAIARSAYDASKNSLAGQNQSLPMEDHLRGVSAVTVPESSEVVAPGKPSSSPLQFLGKLKDRINFIANQFRELFPKLSRLQAFFVQQKLKADRLAALEKLALENSARGWTAGADLANVVNAHYTNTAAELKKALSGSYNWFECDVRLEGPLRSLIPVIGGEPRPVTAHDPFQTNGLLFDDWVKIVSRSGRGIKVDLKTDDALDGVLATLKKHNVVDEKLILNINVTAPGKGPDARQDERLQKIRREFPGCYIKLSPGSGSSKGGSYTTEAVDRLIKYAGASGEPVLFALRAEWVTPEIVKKLEAHGKVSIWNTTWSHNPRNIKQEVEKFRSWGVSGIIDLMSTHKAAE